MGRDVFENQFLDPPGITLREVPDNDLGTGSRNDPDSREEQTVVDLYARYVGVEDEVVGAAN